MPKVEVNGGDERRQAKDKGSVRLEVKVLYCESPSLIYISFMLPQNSYKVLFEEIQKYYSKITENRIKKEWQVGEKCATLCIQSQKWRRAIIIKLENDNAKVFYNDFAFIETVPKCTLRELTPEFSKYIDAAVKCHLFGISPAGGDEWPIMTKEYLKNQIDTYKRFFVTKVGKFKGDSIPVELWVYHTEHGGALEPDKSTWHCVNQNMLLQGLCVTNKTQVVTTEDDTENNEDTLSLHNVTGSINELLQLEPMLMEHLNTGKPDEDNKSLPTEGRETSNIMYKTDWLPTEPLPCKQLEPMPMEPLNTGKPDEDDKSLPIEARETSYINYKTDWLPPEPLPDKEFTALPLRIDNNGVIFLHDKRQKDALDFIRNTLDWRFKNPNPKDKFNKWSVGEPCVALYLDNHFYRGRVVEVNEGNATCIIHYIDYGNDEKCTFENLRKRIHLPQIPAQAQKCILNRIQPLGKQWDRNTLDYIYKCIVEKKCYVKVTGEPVNGVLPIDIKYGKLWLNDHLVELDMAKYTDGS